MSLTHPRKSVIKGEYGRRPYIDKWKAPYRDTQGRVPNKQIFDKKLEQMSEFIKPYLTDDYSSMEHYYPSPHTKFSMYDWSPTGSSSGWDGSFPQPYEFWDLPEGTTTEEMWEEGWTGWYIVGCVLDCFWAPGVIQTDSECEQGEYCCELDAFSPIVNADFISIEGRGAFRVTSFDQNRVCFEFRGDATTTTYPVTLRAYYRHKHGKTIRMGYCDDSIWPRCVVCDCATAVAMTIDEDSTSDTIAPEGSIDVYILNGCPPFTWSASGGEFSFATAETEGRVNTLSATVDACGPTTVTVTDVCETVDTTVIRCTDGQWVWKTDTVCSLSGSGTALGSEQYELIAGNKKQTQHTTGLGCGFAVTPNTCGVESGDCWSVNAQQLLDANHPNCIDPDTGRWPYECDDSTPDWLTYSYYAASFQSLNYYEWEC